MIEKNVLNFFDDILIILCVNLKYCDMYVLFYVYIRWYVIF